MSDGRRYMVDVGMYKFPFPIKVLTRDYPQGQPTIADISVHARILKEFEANWIDRFVQVIHKHKDNISPTAIKQNIVDYQEAFGATSVRINLEYPLFMAKMTPVSKQKCLVKYDCVSSTKLGSSGFAAKNTFKIDIPVITSDPASDPGRPRGLFAQISNIAIEIETAEDIHPEYLVDLVDATALSPVYSFLSREDHEAIIEKVHNEEKSSVVVADEIKHYLSRNHDILWYSIKMNNYGMLHSYSTLVATEQASMAGTGEYKV